MQSLFIIPGLLNLVSILTPPLTCMQYKHLFILSHCTSLHQKEREVTVHHKPQIFAISKTVV